jgi:hypothetical protein
MLPPKKVSGFIRPLHTPLAIVEKFNQSPDIGVHRPIQTKELDFWGIKFIDLDWSSSSP